MDGDSPIVIRRQTKYLSAANPRRGIVIYIKSLSMKERVSIVHAIVADKAVAALLALIDHGDCVIRVHILEHEKLVPKQIHLKYRLFRGHGLYGEALAADDLELLVRLVRNCGKGRPGRLSPARPL